MDKTTICKAGKCLYGEEWLRVLSQMQKTELVILLKVLLIENGKCNELVR